MTRRLPDPDRLKRDEALLTMLVIHGVPVATVASAMGLSRGTIYRRMQQARTNLRRAAQASGAESARRPRRDGVDFSHWATDD